MASTEARALFDNLIAELEQRKSTTFRKRTVELLLGTDRFIGRKQHAIEKRVGVVPAQIEMLHKAFGKLHLQLRTYVIQGAGARARYADSDYVHAGAEILSLEELPFMDGPPDVVHALKEPSAYEATIPKPFCRIGALHSGDFDSTTGLADLLLSGPVAVFDGSNIGAAGAYRIPIRGRMSVVAGQIAAEWLIEHLNRHGATQATAVVVGGGYAGKAAVRTLLDDGRCQRIHLFDDASNPARVETLRKTFAAEPKIIVGGIAGMDDPVLLHALDGGSGIIFAVARPSKEAPRAIRVESLEHLAPGALIVDISIDEGGAIHDPSIRRTWSSKETIPYLTERISKQRGHEYRALSNMPRAYPFEASEAHGEVILPYLAALLFLSAQYGNAAEVARAIHQRTPDLLGQDPATAPSGQILDSLIQDLRNGLALSFRPSASPATKSRIVVEDIIAHKDRVCSHLYASKIPFQISLPAQRDFTISGVEEAIQTCLRTAAEHQVSCTFVSHPEIDGTRTADAARALEVPEDDVLKCIILKRKSADGEHPEYAAAICEGTKRLNLELFERATREGPWELATPDEVMLVTGHTVGGVPILELPGRLPVYMSTAVAAKQTVWASAGSEYAGIGFAAGRLQQLGAIAVELTPPDSIARDRAAEIHQACRALTQAIADDDDERGRKAVHKLSEIFNID